MLNSHHVLPFAPIPAAAHVMIDNALVSLEKFTLPV